MTATAALAAATSAATGVPAKVADPSMVGPGLPGFLVMFGLAIAVWLLMRSMVGHLRKVRYSAQGDGDRAKGRGWSGRPPSSEGTPSETAPDDDSSTPAP